MPIFQMKDTVNAFDAYRRVADVSNPQLKSKAMLQMGNLSEMQKEYESALSFFKEALKADPTNDKARYNYELLKKRKCKSKKSKTKIRIRIRTKIKKIKKSRIRRIKISRIKKIKILKINSKTKIKKKSQEDQEAEDQKQKDDAEQQDGEQSEEEKGKEQEQQQQQEQKEGEEQKDGEEQEMSPSTKQKLEEMNISEEKAQMILEALRNKESQYFQQLRKQATKKERFWKTRLVIWIQVLSKPYFN